VATVTYAHDFPYRVTERGTFPMVQVTLRSAHGDDQAIDVDAYLDSGAERSLFQGALLSGIGLNLFDGSLKRYQSVTGTTLEARVHLVRIEHEQLGEFELEIGFSVGEIARSLLGRDFFDRIQVGFREHHQMFFVESSP